MISNVNNEVVVNKYRIFATPSINDVNTLLDNIKTTNISNNTEKLVALGYYRYDISFKQEANRLGLEAYGVGSDPRKYIGATYREIREILARNKDFVKCIFKPKPTYLGETIPVSGSGDVTNDK